MKNRSVIRFILIGLSLVCTSIGRAQNTSVPSDVMSCLDHLFVTEGHSIQGSDECHQKFLAYFVPNWRSIFTNWDSLATTKKRRYLFLSIGARIADANNYMDFLDQVETLRRDGKIDEEIFEYAVFHPGDIGHKNAFLALNYTNARVKNYLANARSLLLPSHASYVDRILSGEEKSDFEYIMTMEDWKAPASLLLQ